LNLSLTVNIPILLFLKLNKAEFVEMEDIVEDFLLL
jgi:hypothetical protein